MPAGQFYASPIDFNQEGGALEKPHVPTLRVAAPVFATNGERFGILIILGLVLLVPAVRIALANTAIGFVFGLAALFGVQSPVHYVLRRIFS